MSIPPDQDLPLLLAAVHAATQAEVVRRIAAAGHPNLRPTHGYVFQHLIVGPHRVSELAGQLGVTIQGASKLVVELEALGYVERGADPADRRAHVVALTERGREAIEAGRRVRAAVNAEVMEILGERAARDLVASLQRLAEHNGGLATLLGRRLRPEVR